MNKIPSRIATGNERLKAARIEAGYSQLDLASLLDVAEHTITKWETGRTVPDREKQEEAAKALDVKRWEVFE